MTPTPTADVLTLYGETFASRGLLGTSRYPSLQSLSDAIAAARPGMAAMELNAVIQQALVKSNYEQYSSEARGHGTGHGTGMDPEEEAPWIGPGNTTVLQENMVFTLKATITVPNVGGLRTERIVRLTSGGVETLDQFPMELHW